MNLFGTGSKPERGSKTYDPKPLRATRAAKSARRGGNAIVAATVPPRPGRVARGRA